MIMYAIGHSSSLNAGFPLWVKPAAYILPWGHLTLRLTSDENRDSPERDMVNPSTDSYMWPIRGAP